MVFLVISAFANTDICPKTNQTDVTLLPNPKDCHTFYLCDNGIPHLMTCPDGLAFNPKERVCDLPENVNCKTFDVIPNAESVNEEPARGIASEESTDFEDIFEDEDDELQKKFDWITV